MSGQQGRVERVGENDGSVETVDLPNCRFEPHLRDNPSLDAPGNRNMRPLRAAFEIEHGKDLVPVIYKCHEQSLDIRLDPSATVAEVIRDNDPHRCSRSRS
jgi:hypothetical protein